jgi:hypothetical protein
MEILHFGAGYLVIGIPSEYIHSMDLSGRSILSWKCYIAHSS